VTVRFCIALAAFRAEKRVQNVYKKLLVSLTN